MLEDDLNSLFDSPVQLTRRTRRASREPTPQREVSQVWNELYSDKPLPAEKDEPFWDKEAIFALIISAIIGAMIGIPLGFYLHG